MHLFLLTIALAYTASSTVSLYGMEKKSTDNSIVEDVIPYRLAALKHSKNLGIIALQEHQIDMSNAHITDVSSSGIGGPKKTIKKDTSQYNRHLIDISKHPGIERHSTLCYICKLQYPNEKLLSTHFKKEHPNKRVRLTTYTCTLPKCNKPDTIFPIINRIFCHRSTRHDIKDTRDEADSISKN